jgi:hypothetical protein
MMIPMNHISGVQFVLKPPKMPRARGKVRVKPRVDAGMGGENVGDGGDGES